VLIAGPRPAIELPNPSSDLRASVRVSGGKVDSTSSSSGALVVAFLIGIVSPSWNVLRARPGISSTYFRPSAERGRTDRVESTASGSIDLSSLRSSTAIARSSPFTRTRSLLMSFTIPTRKPPARTSLPCTSLAPFGTWASSW
jgi:hypothetical protein